MIHRMTKLALLVSVICLLGSGSQAAQASDPSTPSSTTGAVSPAACPQSPVDPALAVAAALGTLTCTPLQGGISVSPGSVDYNGYTTVSWSVSPAVYTCNISSSPNVWGSAVGPSGGQGVGPLSSTTSFYLHCDATDTTTGGDWSATVSVAAPPPPPPPPPGGGTPAPVALAFTADATQLTAGQRTTLHWACDSNTTNVSITSSNASFTAWTGLPLNGQQQTLAFVEGTYTLALNCSNSAGTDSHLGLTINVGPAPVSAPVNTAIPMVSGTVQVGSTLSTSTGGWANSPTSYSYVWGRCDASGANCSLISGATSTTYLLSSIDAGRTIQSGVAASNSGGTSPYAWSLPTAVVPVPLAPPVIGSFTSNTTGPWSGASVQLGWTSKGSTTCAIASNPSSGGAAGGLAASGSWTTPSLPAGQMQYTLTCSNLAGSAQATLYVGVFNSSEQYVGTAGVGQNTDPWRSLDGSNCRWKSETNQNEIRTRFGSRGGGLGTKVDWCVRGGRIIKVVRSVSIIGANYLLSGWKFDKIVSYGPCNEQCSDFAALYGTNRTSINIWVEGHWSLCMNIPILGSLCAQDAYLYVGVLIRGDGTRNDSYNP